MISEFFHFDTMIVWDGITGKHLSLIPFLLGSMILLYYYTVQKPREQKEGATATL